MKGILFKEPLFNAVIRGDKTQTRRLVKKEAKPRFETDEVVYLKEPFEWDEDKQDIKSYQYGLAPEKRAGKVWVNKLFMSAKQARFFIVIQEVKVEPLQNISASDAIAEGIGKLLASSMQLITQGQKYRDYLDKGDEVFQDGFSSPIDSFRSLWESINGVGSWEKNPLVYVYTFKRIDFDKDWLQVNNINIIYTNF